MVSYLGSKTESVTVSESSAAVDEHTRTVHRTAELFGWFLIFSDNNICVTTSPGVNVLKRLSILRFILYVIF